MRSTWFKGHNGLMDDEVLYIPKPFYRSDRTTYPVEFGYPENLDTEVFFESSSQISDPIQKGIGGKKGESMNIGKLDYLIYKVLEGGTKGCIFQRSFQMLYLH